MLSGNVAIDRKVGKVPTLPIDGKVGIYTTLPIDGKVGIYTTLPIEKNARKKVGNVLQLVLSSIFELRNNLVAIENVNYSNEEVE